MGVYWLPLRHLEGLGFTGASAGIALYIGCLVVLLPFTLRFGATIRTQWRILLFSSLLTGAAFSLFTTALALTDVIRAILLFYLTPAWGTILGLRTPDRARFCIYRFGGHSGWSWGHPDPTDDRGYICPAVGYLLGRGVHGIVKGP